MLRTLALEPGEHDVFAVLNDNIADGRDVSWVWDADFEVLAGRVRRATCAGTPRSRRAATRVASSSLMARAVALPSRTRAVVAAGVVACRWS